MRTSTKTVLVAAAVAVGILVAGGAAAAGRGDDAERPISGPALDEATRAALTNTGEGRVTDTEVGDEDSYYEVEVTLSNGRQVDVQLDADFRVVGTAVDRESDE